MTGREVLAAGVVSGLAVRAMAAVSLVLAALPEWRSQHPRPARPPEPHS